MTSCRISLWCVFGLVFPYVAYLDYVQCCSFAFDKYVVSGGEIGVKVSSQISDFGYLLIDSPMTFIVVWVVLLSCCLLPK